MSIFGGLDLSRASILFGVLKIVLKALIEGVRPLLLTRAAGRQWQVDVASLAQASRVLIPDEAHAQCVWKSALVICPHRALPAHPRASFFCLVRRALRKLVQILEDSGGQRCFDPLPLEAAEVTSILTTKHPL